MRKNDVWVRDRVVSRIHPEEQPMFEATNGGERFSAGGDDRSIRDLFHTLTTDASRLMRQEIELAKAEMREKARVVRSSAASFAIGGVLMFAAFLMALWALDQGLTALLVQVMPLAIAVWLAPLILTAAFAGIGWGMINGGKERIAHEGLKPSRTLQTLADDKRWAEAKVREVKEGIKHG